VKCQRRGVQILRYDFLEFDGIEKAQVGDPNKKPNLKET